MTTSLSRRNVSTVALLFLSALLWIPPLCLAETRYYVDPDWMGNQTGREATPWRELSATSWDAINTSLATDSVTVYFSAREAGTDSDEQSSIALLIKRVALSGNRLTLDGMSQYNTNDLSPSWLPYSGSSRHRVTSQLPVSTPATENSNVTVRGFRLVALDGQVVFWWGGHNVIIEDLDASSSPGATYGPGIYFQYTQEEASKCPTMSPRETCRAWANLTIRRNYVHDTFGEGIYVGGCADTPGCASHTNVLIEANTLRRIAIHGGEADAIDVKDGLRGLVVRNNDVRLQRDSRDGVSLESGALVEGNYVESAGRVGIGLSAFWNDSAATRAGSVVRNNIVVGTGGNLADGYRLRAAVYVDGDTSGDRFSSVGIYSNTIFRILSPDGQGEGINVGGTSISIVNNIISTSTGTPVNAVAGALGVVTSNVFHTSQAGTLVRYGSRSFTAIDLGDISPDSFSVNPLFVRESGPYDPANFHLQSSSVGVDTATKLPDYSNDFFGRLRADPWDIGALEPNRQPPTPPARLRVVP